MACRFDGPFFLFLAAISGVQEKIERVIIEEVNGRAGGRPQSGVHCTCIATPSRRWLPSSCKEGKFWVSHQGMDQPLTPVLHHIVQFSTILFLKNCDICIFFFFFSRGFR